MRAQGKAAVQRLLRSFGWEIRRATGNGSEVAAPGIGPASLGELIARVHKLGVQPQTVIDVGAARGDFSAECSKTFPAARYLLVEPLDEFATLLTTGSREMNATFIQAAASDSPGEVTFHVHADLFGSSLLHERESDVDGIARRVPTVTLDQLVDDQDADGPFLIKVDVQGAELRVLNGAQRTLENAVFVMLEVVFFEFFVGGPIFDEVVEYMSDRGFVVYEILEPLHRPLDGALSQVDLVFVPKGSILRKDHIYATPHQRAAADARFRAITGSGSSP
jgi:FkbM family methyltransferase